MIINGGSNIVFENNVVLGAKSGNAELNFCYQAGNPHERTQVTSSDAAGPVAWTTMRSEIPERRCGSLNGKTPIFPGREAWKTPDAPRR